MIQSAAVVIWGAISVIGAFVLGLEVGSPFAAFLAIVAAALTYLFQIVELSRADADSFLPTTFDDAVQLVLWLAVMATFTLSIVWSLLSHYWS